MIQSDSDSESLTLMIDFLFVNTHRQRRRDSTVELSRVGVARCALNSQLAHDACRRNW